MIVLNSRKLLTRFINAIVNFNILGIETQCGNVESKKCKKINRDNYVQHLCKSKAGILFLPFAIVRQLQINSLLLNRLSIDGRDKQNKLI